MSPVIVTASSASLVDACGWSFRPDVVPMLTYVPPSGAATRGTAFGALAEARINGTPAPGKVELPEDEARKLVAMWEHAARWLEEHARVGWRAEVAFAYDPATDVARELPRLAHRDYSGAQPGEVVAGTADIVAIDGDSVVVFDWKTTDHGAPSVDAVEQLEWLALFAARAWGYDSARIVTLRVTEDGLDAIEEEALDAFALGDVADRIRADVARIPTAEPQPGEHCRGRYCKALSVCPVTRAAMAPALAGRSLLAKRWAFTPAIESPDHVQALMQMRSMVDKASDEVKEAVRVYVGDRELTCTDGTTIKASYKTVPRQDRAQLVALVLKLGGTQEMLDECVRPCIEPAGIKAKAPPKPRKKKAE